MDAAADDGWSPGDTETISGSVKAAADSTGTFRWPSRMALLGSQTREGPVHQGDLGCESLSV